MIAGPRFVADALSELESAVTYPKAPITLRLGKATPEMVAASLLWAEAWEPTRKLGRTMGFDANSGCHDVEVYLENNAVSPVKRIFITGYKPKRFLLRITPRHGMLGNLLPAISARVATMANPPKIKVDKKGRIDVTCAREAVLGSSPMAKEEAAQRLFAFTQPLLAALHV